MFFILQTKISPLPFPARGLLCCFYRLIVKIYNFILDECEAININSFHKNENILLKLVRSCGILKHSGGVVAEGVE